MLHTSLPGGEFALIEWEGEDTASVVSCLQVGGGVTVGQMSILRTAEGGSNRSVVTATGINYACV